MLAAGWLVAKGFTWAIDVDLFGVLAEWWGDIAIKSRYPGEFLIEGILADGDAMVVYEDDGSAGSSDSSPARPSAVAQGGGDNELEVHDGMKIKQVNLIKDATDKNGKVKLQALTKGASSSDKVEWYANSDLLSNNKKPIAKFNPGDKAETKMTGND